jgi:sugar/nucleoside kinase (ribokinase family)
VEAVAVEEPPRPPDLVAVGHVTVDEIEGRLRPGGSALYASLLAHHLGLRVGLFTSFGPDFPVEVLPPELQVAALPATATTRFRLDYTREGRVLTLRARATGLGAAGLPERFAEARMAYLAPVADEVATDLAWAFADAAVGAGAQGWCRRWDRDGRVHMKPWPDPGPVLRHVQALFLSADDVAGWERRALELYQRVPVGALTLAARGAVLFVNGEKYAVPAAPASEVEPTGAGDVFAAAFLVHYDATGDPWEAARYAAVAGALTVEREGILGVPTRAELATRLEAAELRS